VVVVVASLLGHVGGEERAVRNLGVDAALSVVASRSRPGGLVCWHQVVEGSMVWGEGILG
jgi:hypothetical protein